MASLSALPPDALWPIMPFSADSCSSLRSVLQTCSLLRSVVDDDRDHRAWGLLLASYFPEAAGLESGVDPRSVLSGIVPNAMLRVCGAGSPPVNGYYKASGSKKGGRPVFQKIQLPAELTGVVPDESPVLLEFEFSFQGWRFRDGQGDLYDGGLYSLQGGSFLDAGSDLHSSYVEPQPIWPQEPLWGVGAEGAHPPPRVVSLPAASSHPAFAAPAESQCESQCQFRWHLLASSSAACLLDLVRGSAGCLRGVAAEDAGAPVPSVDVVERGEEAIFQCSRCSKLIGEDEPIFMRNDKAFCTGSCRNWRAAGPLLALGEAPPRSLQAISEDMQVMRESLARDV